MNIWEVPKDEWKGQTCFILGGGPSLLNGEFPTFGKKIAINDAFIINPIADLLWFSDRQWFDDNKQDLHLYKGPTIATRCFIDEKEQAGLTQYPIKRLARDMSFPLSRHQQAVAGWCSGANAINIAYLYGSNPIVLLGFDMQGENWHRRHKRAKKDNCYKADFIPYLNRMSVELRKDGIDVINTCMDSALQCFRKQPLSEVLRNA